MKRLGMLLVVAFVSTVTALPVSAAEAGYGAAGCGLGSMLFGNKPGVIQVIAATTNSIAWNQAFGITSGTSNCDKTPSGFAMARLTEFVAANMDSLAKDIARGQGESLQTLVELVGVAETERAEAYATLQADYPSIFPSEEVEAPAVVDAILIRLQG